MLFPFDQLEIQPLTVESLTPYDFAIFSAFSATFLGDCDHILNTTTFVQTLRENRTVSLGDVFAVASLTGVATWGVDFAGVDFPLTFGDFFAGDFFAVDVDFFIFGVPLVAGVAETLETGVAVAVDFFIVLILSRSRVGNVPPRNAGETGGCYS